MRSHPHIRPLTLVLVLALSAVTMSAGAADVYLWAGVTSLTMPDGSVIPMWGYAMEPDGDFSTLDGQVTVPGPMIRVPPGDSTLTIHLYNALPEPVSVVIPSQVAALTPETFLDGQGRQRIRSFAAETAPGAVGTYTWNALSPGTYLYHSGTHPQVQVQMGLYGCVIQDVQRLARAVIGEAYPGVQYDNEVILVYSEIDPALHSAVSLGDYGPGGSVTSTLNYSPQYFLINGRPFPQSMPITDHNITQGERVLVRIVNAGLRSHAPVFQGLTFQLLAEDGTLYPYPFRQHSLHLPAGKTHDLLIETTRSGVFPIWDHSLALTNGAAPSGGMLVHLVVSAQDGSPVATADSFSTTEDQQLVAGPPGVLVNDSDGGAPGVGSLTATLHDPPTHGNVVLNPDGSFTYDPDPDFNGADLFSYTASDGALASDPAAVVIQISPVNDAPVALADTASFDEDTVFELPAPGILGNDTDVDNDALTAVLVSGPAHGTLDLGADGSLTYASDANYFGPDSFTYVASDGQLQSSAAAVTFDILSVNDVPLTQADSAITGLETEVIIPVLDNDIDIDGTIVASTVVVVTPAANGTAVADPDGTVTYTPGPGFTCQDTFSYTVQDNEAGVSASTVVTVDVYGTAEDSCFLDSGTLSDLLSGGDLPNCDAQCIIDLIFQ